MKIRAGLTGLLILVFVCSTMPTAAMPELSTFIIGALNGGLPAKATTFFMKEKDLLALTVVWAESDRFLSTAGQFLDGEETLNAVSPTADRLRSLLWRQLKPSLQEYENLPPRALPFTPGQCVSLKYQRRANSFPISSGDLVLPGEQLGVGTHYLEFGFAGEPSPPSEFVEREPLHELFRGRLVQVVVRADDTYLGFLTELFNTPFLLSPRRTPMGFHQTDYRLGSDCAAFAIYGQRRLGNPIPYCGPFGVYDYLIRISDTTLMPDSEGVYRDGRGMRAMIGETGIRPGDILHFHSQVSVFARDAGIKGVLDRSDWIMQAHGNSPGFFTLADSGYYNRPLMAYRWKTSP